MKNWLLLFALISTMASADVTIIQKVTNGFGMINKKNHQDPHGRRSNLILSNDATCELVYKKNNGDDELWLYGLSGKLTVYNSTYIANKTKPWTKWTTKANKNQVHEINKSTNDCYDLYDWASDQFVLGKSDIGTRVC